MSDFGVLASSINLSEVPDFKLPDLAPDGRIPTPNAMGFATTDVLGPSKEFVDFAGQCKLPVLDGGAAYGTASLAALNAGATVIANEIDQRDLDYIVRSSALTDEQRGRLYLKAGRIPGGLDFPEGSLGAIHLSRVMHFFKPEDIEGFFEKAMKWLAPGGRIYLLTCSPYHKCVPGFAAIYEQRIASGMEWPGEINGYTKDYTPQHAGKAPRHLHIIDPRVIIRVSTKHGFIPKKVWLYGGEDDLNYTCGIFIKPE